MGRHRRDRPSVAGRARIGPSSPRGRSSAGARTEELHESVERAVHWQDPRDPTVGRELGSEGGLLRTEFERRGVDAVPQPRRPRPVIEHVPQVGTAVGTFDLRAAHEQAPILLLANISFLNGRPETRPAGPRVELGPRREEFGFCCHKANRVPEGSSNTANQPWPMTSAFGTMIFPPAFLTFS